MARRRFLLALERGWEGRVVRTEEGIEKRRVEDLTDLLLATSSLLVVIGEEEEGSKRFMESWVHGGWMAKERIPQASRQERCSLVFKVEAKEKSLGPRRKVG